MSTPGLSPLDTALHIGDPKLPACVLIHGLGMNKHMWAEPANARIMGGLLPMRVMLTGYDEPVRTLFHDLSSKNYTVITWSQRRPVGPTEGVVQELYQVMDMLSLYIQTTADREMSMPVFVLCLD